MCNINQNTESTGNIYCTSPTIKRYHEEKAGRELDRRIALYPEDPNERLSFRDEVEPGREALEPGRKLVDPGRVPVDEMR